MCYLHIELLAYNHLGYVQTSINKLSPVLRLPNASRNRQNLYGILLYSTISSLYKQECKLEKARVKWIERTSGIYVLVNISTQLISNFICFNIAVTTCTDCSRMGRWKKQAFMHKKAHWLEINILA